MTKEFIIIKTKLLIIGSGPAGLTAAIYSARSMLDPILIEGMQPGGQLTITTDVENYPGYEDAIHGQSLMENMKKQAINNGAKIFPETAIKVDLSKRPFKIYTDNDKCYESESIIIATGASAKWLSIESEQKFLGYGVSGCATCDGPFFKNEKIIVVGGGNTAVEESLFLTKYASHVYLVHRRDELRAEKVLQQKLFDNNKITVLWNNEISEIIGETTPYKRVVGVKLINTQNKNITNVECSGVFIAIGHKPNTNLFKDLLELDEYGYIITKENSTKTSVEGVFASGDVHDKIYRQAVTAAGYGCMAAIEANKFLEQSK